ncbi:hypothetical protein [Dorea formicigenerans]|nr:hypothetical protein [Dorea formicigenerans]
MSNSEHIDEERAKHNKELAKQENEARRSEHRPHKKQNMEL